MRRRASLFCVMIGFSCGPAFAAEKPFYGDWSCAMVADNAVNVQDWSRESYSDDGVALGPDGNAEKLKVKLIRKNVYELTYGGGAKARLVMKEPWMFTRGTLEHSYICLRKGS